MGDFAAEGCAFDKWTFEFHPKPRSELVRVGNRAPHPRARRSQNHFLFDEIGIDLVHSQPPCCKSSTPPLNAQPFSCRKFAWKSVPLPYPDFGSRRGQLLPEVVGIAFEDAVRE